MLISLNVVIISQCKCILNDQVVYLNIYINRNVYNIYNYQIYLIKMSKLLCYGNKFGFSLSQ